jgi:hypothetical protein
VVSFVPFVTFSKPKKELTYPVADKTQSPGTKGQPVPQRPAVNAGRFATRAGMMVLPWEELETVSLWT